MKSNSVLLQPLRDVASAAHHDEDGYPQEQGLLSRALSDRDIASEQGDGVGVATSARPQQRRRRACMWAIGITLITVAVLMATVAIVIKLSISSNLNNAEVRMLGVTLGEAGVDTLALSLSLAVTFHSKMGSFFHISATMDPSVAILSIQSPQLSTGPIGQLTLPRVTASSDGETVWSDLPSTLTVTNSTAFALASQAALKHNTVPFTLQGKVNVRVWGIPFYDNSYSHTVEQGGLGGQASVTIEGISIAPPSGSWVRSSINQADLISHVTIYNPSNITIQLESLVADVYYNNTRIGIASVSNYTFVPGPCRLDVPVTMQVLPAPIDGQPSIEAELVSRYLHGRETTLSIQIVHFGASDDNIWRAALPYLDMQMRARRLGSMGTGGSPLATPVTVEWISGTIEDVTAGAIATSFQYRMSNPTHVTGVLYNVSFDIEYHGLTTGRVVLAQLALLPGMSSTTATATLYPLGSSTISPLVQALIMTSAVPITFTGCTNGPAMSQLLSATPVPLTIPGLGGLSSLQVADFTVTDTTPNRVLGNLTLSLDNPTSLQGNLGTVSIAVYHQGVFIGNGTKDSLVLVRGRNLATFTVSIHPIHPVAVAQLVNRYLQGLAINITCHAEFRPSIPGVTPTHDPLAQVTLHHTVPGTGRPVKLQVQQIQILDAKRDAGQLVIGVHAVLDNPSTTRGTIGSAQLSVSLVLGHQAHHLGSTTFDNVNLVRGRQTLNVKSYLAPDNTTLLAILAGNYVMGVKSTIRFRGSATYPSTLSQLLADYQVQADIAPSPTKLITEIDLVKIKAHLGTSIKHPIAWSAGADASITNVLPFPIYVESLVYDVYFNNSDGCSFFLGALKYPPAFNIHLGVIRNEWSPLLEIPASKTTRVSGQINTSGAGTIEKGLRLYHEYYQKHSLYLNLVGHVRLKLFSLDVPFVFTHQKVT